MMKGLKLWEKNYVLTLGVCYFILFGGIFFILQFSFWQNLERESAKILESRDRFSLILFDMLREDKSVDQVEQYCEILRGRGIYISISTKEETVVNFLPFSDGLFQKLQRQGNAKGPFRFLKDGKRRYAYLEKDFLNSYKEMKMVYVEDVSIIYQNQTKNNILFLSIASAIAVLLAVVFYYSMKKLYQPVSNIAHELRTPLTAIQGYAQYILLGKVTPEDIAHASSRIEREARYMNDLVERILIMGNLRDHAIAMKEISANALAEFVADRYPSVRTEIFAENFYGDQTLLESLLSNLLSNAGRYGEEITVSFRKEGIHIYSRGDCLSKRKLHILNGNRAMPAEMIDGKGLGVPLCHEIARLHHGRLHYANVENGVEIVFRYDK